MINCARCGNKEASAPDFSRVVLSGEYKYCDDCQELFEDIYTSAVVVESNHGKKSFEEIPYTVSDNKPTSVEPRTRQPRNQVQALADGKRIMELADVRGLFIYRKSGSVWLIEEYLDAHPPIAGDVHNENSSVLQKFNPFS